MEICPLITHCVEICPRITPLFFNEVLEVIGGYKSYVTRMEEKEGKIDYFLVCLPKILLSILRK